MNKLNNLLYKWEKKIEQNFVAFFSIFIFAALQKKLIKKLIRRILLNNKVKERKTCAYIRCKNLKLEKLHSGLAFVQFCVFACECSNS